MDGSRSGEPSATRNEQEGGLLPPGPLKPESKQGDIPFEVENQNGSKPKRRLKDRWREFWAADTDRHVELILAGAITLFALCQLVITCSNNSSTSNQVDKLIAAANSIQASANSFSESSSNINNGIDDAVGKLEDQVQRMDETRTASDAAAQNALKATIDNFHRDQRAWLAVVNTHGTKPEVGKPFMAYVEIRDTGRTPAKNIVVDGAFAAYPKGMPVNFGFGLTQQRLGVISPGGDRSIISEIGTAQGLDKAETDQFQTMDIYDYGTVQYDDIFGVHHWITYCSRLSDDRSQYTYCQQHNDADNDQR